MKNLSQHPCFNLEAKHSNARVHLPIAPRCNVQCNYCNRKYDCCNETRPGVSSSILSPEQSVEYLKCISQKIHNISVVGIAGPGDPFANPSETLSTIKLVKRDFPEMLFCISSNGLNLAPYIDELYELGVTHITITINSFEPKTLSNIYRWIRFNKRVYRGEEAGKVLIEQQLLCLEKLRDKNIKVKINTVVCLGVNDKEIEDIAKKVAGYGVDIMNCIPMYPVENTEFENLKEPSKRYMSNINKKISKYITPMVHCRRCRADAAGLLGDDNTEFTNLIKKYSTYIAPVNKGDRVAVASREGILVNLHLGETQKLYIFERRDERYHFIETRNTPEAGGGAKRWVNLIDKVLFDCQAILVTDIGENPSVLIQGRGIRIVKMTGLIESGLDHIYLKTDLKTLCASKYPSCSVCRGDSTGC